MTLEPLPSIYSIESFEKWLRKFALREKVGEPCSPGMCAVAEWLRSEFGADPGISPVSIRMGNLVYDPPRWLRTFIAGIDDTNGKITAAKALKIWRA